MYFHRENITNNICSNKCVMLHYNVGGIKKLTVFFIVYGEIRYMKLHVYTFH